MKTLRLLLAGIIIASVGVQIRADTITLTDGRVIQGHLDRRGNNYIIHPDHGPAFEVPVKDLASIELGGGNTPAVTAQNAWHALEYNISRQKNLDAVIKSITAYELKYPHSPLLSDAQKTLAKYKMYKSKGFVLFAGKWVAASQVKTLIADSAVSAKKALANYKAGQFASAATAATKALKINPANANALIIRGAVDYRLGNLQAAGRCFFRELSTDPHNVIALNDMAVTVYHQRQEPRALVYYTKALDMGSSNRLLLDNIYIAMNHYTLGHATLVFKNLSKLFTPADAKIQAVMAEQGLYRVGGTWVKRSVRRKMLRKIQAYKKKKSRLQAKYNTTKLYLQTVQKRLALVIAQIKTISANIAYVQAQEYYTSQMNGTISMGDQAVISSYLVQLANAKTQKLKLEDLNSSTLGKMHEMRMQARQIEKSVPAQALLGHQRIMLPGDLTHVPPPAPLMVAGSHLQLK